MGVPIMRPDPDPLPMHKGYFCAHVSANEVGSYSVDVFVRQQREAAAAFTPLVSVDGGTLQPAWAGQRLHWLSGASNEGGAFFRMHSCGQLEYLGTARHPSPDYLDFPDDSSAAAERHVSPGYVHYVRAEDVEDDSTDEEGYQDAPAVYLGGEPPLAPTDRPSCLRCQGPMQFIGHVQSDVFIDELDEQTILLWYCADCRVQCCLDR
ncbi:hypothetical protein ABPG75_002054 [Micractinium tetrahymenae]